MAPDLSLFKWASGQGGPLSHQVPPSDILLDPRISGLKVTDHTEQADLHVKHFQINQSWSF